GVEDRWTSDQRVQRVDDVRQQGWIRSALARVRRQSRLKCSRKPGLNKLRDFIRRVAQALGETHRVLHLFGVEINEIAGANALENAVADLQSFHQPAIAGAQLSQNGTLHGQQTNAAFDPERGASEIAAIHGLCEYRGRKALAAGVERD